MMLIKTITLDVSDSRITSPVNVQKLSSGDRIDIYLRSGTKSVKLGDSVRARILAKKPDGTNLFNDCTHDGDKISYIITSQTICVPGIVECQLMLTESGKDLYSPVFMLNVSDNLDIGIESADESTAFGRYLADMDRKEYISNKTTSLSAESTDVQYPSAKAVFDALDKVKNESPTVSVSEASGGHNVVITDKNGSKSFKVSDGKTPVRGTDYWTQTDIAYIKSYVDEAVLGGEW